MQKPNIETISENTPYTAITFDSKTDFLDRKIRSLTDINSHRTRLECSSYGEHFVQVLKNNGLLEDPQYVCGYSCSLNETKILKEEDEPNIVGLWQGKSLLCKHIFRLECSALSERSLKCTDELIVDILKPDPIKYKYKNLLISD